MREILFRGAQNVDGSKSLYWHEGYLISEKNSYTGEDEYYIENENGSFLIVSETAGQYTGLTDKNGKKIFEWDIVIFNRKRNLPNTNPTPEVIVYNQRDCAFQRYPYFKALLKGGAGKLIQPDMMSECEVIGNIYDNPELLKE